MERTLGASTGNVAPLLIANFDALSIRQTTSQMLVATMVATPRPLTPPNRRARWPPVFRPLGPGVVLVSEWGWVVLMPPATRLIDKFS